VTFTPAYCYREFFGVDVIYASVTKRFDGPSNGSIGCGGTGDAAADAVGQIAKFLLEGRSAKSALNHGGREF
jgi:hypothetical protein